MATNATNSTPGRTARVIRWLLPQRRQIAFSLAFDAILTILRLPLWMHLALGGVIHVGIYLGRRVNRRS